jgi:carboxyl-terminal processing protease
MPNRPNNPLPKLHQVVSICLVSALLSACGGGSSSGSGNTLNGVALSNTEFLIKYMKEWYLWNERLPASALASSYADQNAALKALRVTEDKFSGITPEADYNSFNVAGQLTGYGISYLKNDAGIVLQQVQPKSPAFAAGLRRGDEILTINGKNISELANTEAVSTEIGPNEAGIKGTFQVRTPDLVGSGFQAPRSLTMTKASYPVSYVFAATTMNSSQGKIGYIHFYSFTGANQSEWNSALTKVIGEGAQHLILDLRDNGGGVINDSVLLASSLGAKGSADPNPNALTGRLAVRLEHNAEKKALDLDYRFTPQTYSGAFDQVVIITSTKTCSASEIVIQALKPFRSIKTVGSTTCGKPYGSTPTNFNGFVYSILSFQNKNSLGEGNYADGLAPDCAQQDNYLRNMGDPEERLLVAARQWIETGQCPDAALLPKEAKASPENSRNLNAQWAFWRGIEKDTGFQ